MPVHAEHMSVNVPQLGHRAKRVVASSSQASEQTEHCRQFPSSLLAFTASGEGISGAEERALAEPIVAIRVEHPFGFDPQLCVEVELHGRVNATPDVQETSAAAPILARIGRPYFQDIGEPHLHRKRRPLRLNQKLPVEIEVQVQRAVGKHVAAVDEPELLGNAVMKARHVVQQRVDVALRLDLPISGHRRALRYKFHRVDYASPQAQIRVFYVAPAEQRRSRRLRSFANRPVLT